MYICLVIVNNGINYINVQQRSTKTLEVLPKFKQFANQILNTPSSFHTVRHTL